MRKRGIKRKGHPHQPRAAASSNTGLLGPAAQSGFPMSQSGDLAPGWFPLKHEKYGDLPCYYHATSRVVSWCTPYPVDLGLVTEHAPPRKQVHECEPLLDALAARQVSESDALRPSTESESPDGTQHRGQVGGGSGTPASPSADLISQDEVERELAVRPRTSVSDFKGRRGDSIAKRVKLSEIPVVFLRLYASEVLAARVSYQFDVPTEGPWTNPPARCRVSLLGVVVAEALATAKEVAASVAAEEACLALCPLQYWTHLREQNIHSQRVIKPPITDPSVADSLLVDDPRVHDLDACIGMLPAQMVREHIIRTHGALQESYDTRVSHRKTSDGRKAPCYECTVTLGPNSYTGFDSVKSRAKQKAAITYLVATHPNVLSWGDMLRRYTRSQKDRPLLPPRSQAAEEILTSDKLTVHSQQQKLNEKRRAERTLPLLGADGGDDQSEGEYSREQGAAKHMEGASGSHAQTSSLQQQPQQQQRQVPGAGHNFAYNWRRQFELEHAKQVALSEGVRIENDTLFALNYDQERETMDTEKLEKLRGVVLELESTELTEQLRANEPIFLGRSNQQAATQPFEASLASNAVFEWTPWKPGTKSHARLMALARPSAGELQEKEEERIAKRQS